MTAIGVFLTFVVFVGMGFMLEATRRKEKDIEYPGLYRHAHSGTKA